MTPKQKSKAPKTDCFAWNKEKSCCIALNRTYCETSGKCAFYKTVKQNERDKLKALKRLGIKTK